MTGPEGTLSADAPLTLELLADLHAGVFDEPVAAALRRRAAADPHAGIVLAALDATVADLAALPHQRTPRLPDDVAHRLDAALDAEAQRNRRSFPAPLPAPGGGMVTSVEVPQVVADLTARRRRLTGWAGVAVLAAAAAAVSVVALSGVQLEIAGTPQGSDALGSATGVQPVRPSAPLAVTRGNLGEALNQALTNHDYGPLTPPRLLRNCLTANGVPATSAPLGGTEVTLDGRRGVLLVLPTGLIAQVRLLVVGPHCGPANPAAMADHVVTR